MKIHLRAFEEGNWSLIIIGSITLLVGILLIILSIIYWRQLGWWAGVLFCSGIISVYLCVRALKENKPEWLLLDLILPG